MPARRPPPTVSTLPIIALALAALVAVLGAAIRIATRGRGPLVARAVIVDPEDHTVTDAGGAVRSTQCADLTLPLGVLEELWSPAYLERLARTYWRYLTRCTLGLIQVRYARDGRRVVLLVSPLTLLRFGEPEYELDGDRGVVRWRIERGLLVSRRGHDGDGELRIEVRRRPAARPDEVVVHVEVTVANFYPSIASGLSQWIYENTQSRIHVIVTHGFLRSLARLDLAESRVGWFGPDGR